jgi:hypothetical protein
MVSQHRFRSVRSPRTVGASTASAWTTRSGASASRRADDCPWCGSSLGRSSSKRSDLRKPCAISTSSCDRSSKGWSLAWRDSICSWTCKAWRSALPTGSVRVPGRRLHDVRGGERGHRLQLRFEAESAHQRSPLRQDGRDDSQGHRLVGGRLGGAAYTRSQGSRCGASSSRSAGPPSAPSCCTAPTPYWRLHRRCGATARRTG